MSKKRQGTELKDFQFLPKASSCGGQIVLSFEDEFNTELSIITGGSAYGNEEAPYEIAVFRNGDTVRLPGIGNNDSDVQGYLTEEEVNGIIMKLMAITKCMPVQV